MNDPADLRAPQVTITLRVQHANGTAHEVQWCDNGRVDTIRYDVDQVAQEWLSATIEPSGAVTVSARDAAGAVIGPVAPSSTQRQMNAYGVTVERDHYGYDIVVERVLDDNDRLDKISLRGPWGSHTTALHADGSRTVTWETALPNGRQSWDASGRRTTYEMTLPNGTTVSEATQS